MTSTTTATQNPCSPKLTSASFEKKSQPIDAKAFLEETYSTWMDKAESQIQFWKNNPQVKTYE